MLLERLAKGSEAEIRRAAAKGVCYLMKRAPSPELWKAGFVIYRLLFDILRKDCKARIVQGLHNETKFVFISIR